MIFHALMDSAARGELILIDGGLCRYHLRRDGQLTIYEIIAVRPGAGTEMLSRLHSVAGVTFILARCPAELPSNAWYKRKGFVVVNIETTRRGRALNVWRLSCS